MSDPMMKLQILAHSEMALAEIRVQRAVRRAALFAVAMVFALLGLGMLNFSVFYAVSPSQGPAIAALIVALTDVAIAGAVLLIARTAAARENEERLAREIRDIAAAELNRDIEQARGEITETIDEVRALTTSIRSFSSTTANTIVPVLGSLARAFKKR
jgi:hypothetical protein